ncbi:Na/Pi symporter [bacterium]|nr:Na/Pi symporter [bacterium]
MPESLDIWKLLAGLGIFMFGMFQMEESIKNLAGRSFKGFIKKSTKGRIRSVASGAFVTAILQSSSAVSLMVLAFVGARIMAMENAIGVILGSNIGTTATAWIVAFFGFKVNIEDYSLPLIGLGGLGLIFLGKSAKYSNISKLMVGFGFLFMGLDYMKTSVMELTQAFDVAALPDFGILPFALVGLLLTAIMQSSSATIAIVLTSLNAEVIGFDAAAAMVVGANVGTTITVILGTIGGSQVKKRVALSHLTFNVITAIIGLSLLPLMTRLIVLVLGPVGENAVMGVALFHTFFNVLGVLVFLPFIGFLSKGLIKVYPDKMRDTTKYIQNVTPEVSEAAVEGLRNEVLHLATNVLKHNLHALHIPTKEVFEGIVEPKRPSQADQYEDLKLLQSEIFSFASTLLSGDVSKEESELVNTYLHGARMALHSAKSVKDEIHNFEEFETSDNSFLRTENDLFKKRLIKLYKKVVLALAEEEHSDIAASINKMLKLLAKEDRKFIQSVTKATAEHTIKDLDISTMLLVNRAFNQSSRQLIYALKNVLLTTVELELLEKLTDETEDSEDDDS